MNGKRTHKLTLELLEDRCVPSAGFLDPTFDFDGVATTATGGSGRCHAVATYAPGTANAGKIVAVGQGWGFALVRYNPNGSLDSTFGTGGIVNNIFGDDATAVATVGDKIVVGGRYHKKNQASVFALARFNSDGSLDQTFGSGGIASTSFGNNTAADALEIAVQADGKIVQSGLMLQLTHSNGRHFAVARYTPNGVLDTTFGSGG